MKKNILKIYLIEALLLISIIMFKINPLSLSSTNQMLGIDITLFILTIIAFIALKFQKDNNYYKGAAIRITVLSLLAIVLLMYGIGLFTGFNRNAFSLTFVNILKNTIPVIISCVSIELLRYIIAKNSFFEKSPIIIYTLLLIILNIIMEINTYDFSDFEGILKFVSVLVLPTVGKEIVLSYVTYTVSYIPSLIYRLSLELYIYLFPIIPDLGDYLYSVVFILLPFIYYLSIYKINTYNEKADYHSRRIGSALITIPLLLITIIVIVLSTGITKYKMVSIVSNSMNPVYSRGDAIIYEKTKAEDIKVGQILVFESDGMTITHRVIKKWDNDGVITFKTKGDNNKDEDNFEVTEDQVFGSATMVIKYVGFPSIWLSRK